MALSEGTHLGSYEILSILGKGGMGEVYRARDKKLAREVALKVLPDELSSDPDRLSRFEREARLLASLNHPHIVTIFSVEEAGGTRFFTMELVDGETLESHLDSGPLSLEDFFACALPIAEAVSAAHRQGVIHRDLKPANVMLHRGGWVKVLDFGLAKGDYSADASPSSQDPTEALTAAGAVVGTVPYMSPEQLRGQQLKKTTDVFSLGTVLYEMVAGTRPFEAASQADLVSRILRDDPMPASSVRGDLSPGFDKILERCLEKEPEGRYNSGEELLEALKELARGATGATAGASGPLLDSGSLLAPASAKSYRTPMVGREQEAQRLRDHLDKVQQGEGSLVTLTGEPGVGKTRLSWDLIEQARQEGFLTVVGNCYEGEGAPPFNPWVETLQMTSQLVHKQTLFELLGETAPQMAKLLPELRRLFPDMPPALELPAEEGRHYLFRGFTDFLQRSSQRQPILILLEDLHWADEPSLLLLQHLAPQLQSMRILVLATYRDVELDVGKPLAATVREMVRNRLVDRIALRRLDEAGLAALLAGLGARDGGAEALPENLVRAIYSETEGNPFFAEEVYFHLDEEGRIFDDSGEFRKDLSLEELDVPEGVRLVVGRRLDRLGEGGQEILTIAAVIGRRFAYSLLRAVADNSESALLDQIESAERLRLIELETGSRRDPIYRFGHELVRQTLIQALSMPRRQRFHLRIGEALEELGQADRRPSVLAHHFYEAGLGVDAAKSAKYLRLAARRAVDSFAPEEALRHLDRTRELLAPEDDQALIEVLDLEGLALRQVGRWEEALTKGAQGLELSQKLELSSEARGFYEQLVWLYVWLGRPGDAANIAMAMAESMMGEERARGLATAAIYLSVNGDALQAEGALQEATSCAATDDPATRAELRVARWFADYYSHRAEAAHKHLGAAQQAVEQVYDPWQAAAMYGDYASCLVPGGHVSELGPLIGRGRSANQKFVNRVTVGWLECVHRGLLWASQGDLEVLADISLTDEVVAGEELEGWLRILVGQRGMQRLWRGNWEEALLDFSRQKELAVQDGNLLGLEIGQEMLACSLLDRRADVEGLLEEHRGRLPVAGELSPVGSWEFAFYVTEACARIGRDEQAAALYPTLQQAKKQGVKVRWIFEGLVETTLGVSAACGGEYETAERHFAEALRQADELPLLSETAVVRHWWGWTLLRRGGDGDRERAAQVLGEAISIYEKMGIRRHAEAARALLGPVNPS